MGSNLCPECWEVAGLENEIEDYGDPQGTIQNSIHAYNQAAVNKGGKIEGYTVTTTATTTAKGSTMSKSANTKASTKPAAKSVNAKAKPATSVPGKVSKAAAAAVTGQRAKPAKPATPATYKQLQAKHTGPSKVEGPVYVTWELCNKMQGQPRKAVIAAAVAAGVSYYTARTQYQLWLAAWRNS